MLNRADPRFYPGAEFQAMSSDDPFPLKRHPRDDRHRADIDAPRRERRDPWEASVADLRS